MRDDHMGMSVAIPRLGACKKALLSSIFFNPATLAVAMTTLSPSSQALAQCAPSAPASVSISSGSCSDPALTTRESANVAPVIDVSGTGSYSGTSVLLTATGSGHGVRASGKGTANLIGTSSDAVSEITTNGTGGHGLHAEAGGVITGNYTTVTIYGTNAYGISAVGANSSVTLTDSSVSTVLDNAHGAYAVGGGIITLTRTDLTIYGTAASAAFADVGGAITLNYLNTFSFGDNAPGAAASGVGSNLILNNGYINGYGSGGAVLFATGGGTVTMGGGAIASGDYYGGTINSDAPGMLARGVDSSIVVRDGASTATYGANSQGVWADAGGSIDFAGYGIFTYQPNSTGSEASGAYSTVILTNTIVRTSGPSSAGLLVTDAGTITVTGTEITTGFTLTGSNPPVLQFPAAEVGLESHGADVIGTGSELHAQNATITTIGDGSIGVRVSQGATAVITGGTITTKGGDSATFGGADGVRSTDAGSTITLTGTKVTTQKTNAIGLHSMAGGSITASNATVATMGSAAHGLASANGGTLTASGSTIAVNGSGSSAVYLAGSAPSTVSFSGGSLSAANGPIILAEGGVGTISINGNTTIKPAVVNGQLLLAKVTEDAAGASSNLILNINGISSLTGDIVVDPSTLTYNLSNSRWTGNLMLVGAGNTVSASLTTSQWTGDLLADTGNTADLSLAQDSLWTGLARNATDITIDANSIWNVTGHSNATDAVANSGLIQFLPRSNTYTTLTVGSYSGSAGSRIGFNTYLGADNSPSNLLVINGGQAGGTTSVLVNNTGGPGEQTTADGIRLVQVTNGGTTTNDAFTLGQRVTAGAYEYQLFRGGRTDSNDWFLRSHIIDTPTAPATEGPEIPLYRPEVALYAPIPAIARQMGLATLGTLHERVGEEENLRGVPQSRTYVNGAWGRMFGEHFSNRWGGSVDASAKGDLTGFQTGLDILRRTTDSGHRDHAGLYFAYSNYDSSSVRGFAQGTQDLGVGELTLKGPSLGAYWTHFAPSGWYVDAVVQGSWYDADAVSAYNASLTTNTTGYTASLEAGYPIRFGEDDRWLIEPQAQIVYQYMSVDGSHDQYSRVDWDAGRAWTGRLGARLQYLTRDERGTLWQPYARFNLWHSFSGNDTVFFGPSSPAIENSFGDTALEIGGGLTVRLKENVSLYGQASYRWSPDSGRSNQTATAGTFGIRFDW
ncbi:autotransporter outer membrane beta-barrel domain-containing protein [Brucella pituitosa]|uniref:Autotransporter outer membrane beta-barrel domain-containing protein n=1 Tax=Brucella pituitosa TaxID=571256 RepID=A0A643EV58_9HYPH|nr:autotransporter outer membrane beta-barrel domain-containing protein [Brucella pituitosa]KAB0567707.1 autotransporter outer membrane beta-barrel domain-containing protein [Brucella pituitosa]